MGRKPSESDTPKRRARADAETSADPAVQSTETPQQELIPGAGRPFPERERVEGAKERLSFATTPEGILDVGAIKKRAFAERAKEVLRKSMADPDVRAWCGVSDAAAPMEQPVPPQAVGFLFDVISKFEGSYFAKKIGVKDAPTIEKIQELVKLDANEHAMFDVQASKLISKYIPAKYLDAADLWIFFVSFGAVQTAKYNAIVAAFGRQVPTQEAGAPSTRAEETAPAPTAATDTEIVQ